MTSTSPLKSTQWLADNLDQAHVKTVDASWYLKSVARDPVAEYAAGHIPGAVRFDIDEIADKSSHLPHMLAKPEAFATAVGQMGIADTDVIVVYDGMGLFSAARVWWNFRVMGAPNTFVLAGGLPKWKAESRPLSQVVEDPAPTTFKPRMRPELVANADDVLALLATPDTHQVVDVRAAARFSGAAPDARAGIRSGHMPGALNLPFSNLIEEGMLIDDEALRAHLDAAGIDLSKPVVASCGSGVTANILALALAQLGTDPVRVYDGSWTEWGADTRLPVVKD